ncbi:hypothetical protein M4D51_02910 [Microbacterium sp. p3-SID338]|uniref:hypothetical protein n=1 Tax=Microbacterium sp. p3-SID338 TaxID=2916214 RepID=UPI0021A6B38D|nr:hypothetical protein [Microbacterium sp. p3-SID338]MCT1394670.1 hypothetical protein [Microbacterium sp. p3-SID338]
MSVEGRMASRAVFELLLTLAGWGLAITAVVMFVRGEVGAGVGFAVGAVAAFGVSAASSKRKTSAHYAGEQMSRAIAFLRQGQYSQAVSAAQKSTEIAASIDELKPGLSVSLILLATARAAAGDEAGARRDLRAALDSANRYPALGEDITPIAHILQREFARGVPDPGLLVRAVLDA